MFKLLLIPLNLFFLVGLSSLLDGGIEISQEAPDRIPTQGTCEVTLTINKGNIAGFAKFQHAFPEGVTIEEIETAGATFTFSDQKMKWIWMALPQEESFVIKYKLTIDNPDLTEVELGGAFSYLQENNRKSFFVPSKMLLIGEEPQEEVKEPVVATKRTVTDEGNGNYLVAVELKREHVAGFAKIQEYIPQNATATGVEEQGSVFSVVNNKVKFVWMNLPEAETFTVSYRINTGGSALDETQLTGEFAYIHDGQTMKASILADGVQLAENNSENPSAAEPEETTPEPVQEEVVAEETTPEPIVEEPTVIPTPVEPAEEEVAQTNTEEVPAQEEEPAEEIAVNQTVEEEPAVVQEQPKPIKKKVTTVPVANSGVNYRVQLIAGHNNVDANYFSSQYQYAGSFIVETHEGWMKYTTGDYPIYRDARDGREGIKTNYAFPGPFVVAYNNGERITVQEALMITNQKWVQ